MKNITFAFIIATGLGIPGLSHAEGTATGISASFERDLNRQPVISYAVRQEIDPVQYLVNNTLRESSDHTFASLRNDITGMGVLD